MEVEKTYRGFQIIYFKDRLDEKCTIQQSSAIDDTDRGWKKPGSSFLWLGKDERMHLSRKHVLIIIGHLLKWYFTGKL